MATYYVRSTDGDNADDGSTWALADADLHTPTKAAGDTVYVSDNHAQSTSTSITIATAGTLAAPTKILCVDDSAEPPTALATTGTVTTTTNAFIAITGSCYVYGLSFFSGTGGSASCYILMNSGTAVFKNCSFQNVNTQAGNTIAVGSTSGSAFYRCTWEDCTVKFSAVGQRVAIQQALFEWHGGSVLSGGTTPTNMFAIGGNGAVADIAGVDFSNLATTFNMFAGGAHAAKAVVRDCKLPTGWTGVLGVPTGPAQRFEMYNCDSGDTNYRLWISDYAGSIRDETTIIRTGGASDGTTGISWKMVTLADAEYPVVQLQSPEIVQWNETTGSSLTATIEIVHDSMGAGSGSKFQDDEIWLEVMYLGTSGNPLGTWITDCKADVLAAAANQTDSSETWTTTGLTTPVKQKLSVTFTAQEKGFIHARVVMAKAGKTAYICPKLAVT
jgi:hypothetical protein